MKRYQDKQEHSSHLSIRNMAVTELQQNSYAPVVAFLPTNEITMFTITHLTPKIPDVSILNC
jgi:hypothetical protein